MGEDVEHRVWIQQARDRPLQIAQSLRRGVFVHPPRPPEIDRKPDRAVAQFLALGGDAEDVAGEQLWDVLLIVVVDLERPIDPAHGRAHWGLGLDQDQREAVDEQHQIGAALGGAGAEDVLGGDDGLILIRMLEVDQADGDVFVIGAERHRAFAAQPGGEGFVGSYESVTAD